MTADGAAADEAGDAFAGHVPAWRRRRLRALLIAAIAEAERGIAGPPDEHRALRRARARHDRRAAPRPLSAPARSVEHGARGILIGAAVDGLLTANPAMPVTALHRVVAAQARAHGLPVPRLWRFRRWLTETGRHLPARRG